MIGGLPEHHFDGLSRGADFSEYQAEAMRRDAEARIDDALDSLSIVIEALDDSADALALLAHLSGLPRKNGRHLELLLKFDDFRNQLDGHKAQLNSGMLEPEKVLEEF